MARVKSLHFEVNCNDVCKLLHERTQIRFVSYSHSEEDASLLESLAADWDVFEACRGNKIVTNLDLVTRDYAPLYPILGLVLLARDHFAATLQVLTIEVQVPHTAWYDHLELVSVVLGLDTQEPRSRSIG